MREDQESLELDHDEEEVEFPQIFADIEIRRTIRGLPETTMRLWTGLKQVIFLAALAGLFYFALMPGEAMDTGRLVVVCVVVWMLWDQVFARHRIGTSFILVTSKGILSTADNAYVRWEEIESYLRAGSLLRFSVKHEAAPKGFFSSRHFDVPLSESNADFIVELFQERVPRWKPE